MIAIMDMVFAFPDDETVYIGLFMVDHDVQGYGIGSIIIEEYAEYIRTLGKKTIDRCGHHDRSSEQEDSYGAGMGMVSDEPGT